jgi:Fe(3+) dicitrate transport protein
VTAGIMNEQFRVNVAASYVSEMRTQAGQGPVDPSEAIPSHLVWDLTAAWNFTANLSTYLKVDNLFDNTYIAARRPSGARPGLPRTAYLGLSFRL